MNTQGLPLVVARILLALMFVLSGFSKLAGLEGTAGYIASVGLPAPTLLALGAGVLEVVAGVALIVGFQARWAALALALFTLVATFLFHAYWSMPKEQQFMQMLMFQKNLGIVGGLLFVYAFGAGTLSLDARREAA
ncbi:MAG TPA: DoxX family protein [Burkholderiaceae bacterium]|nr:DoxX family protein [Burkholderiaceae bacterium]